MEEVGHERVNLRKEPWNAILICESDLMLVQCHVDKLRNTKRPEPSLHHFLANRVEAWRQQTTVSPPTTFVQADFDSSWSLFDQASMDVSSDAYTYFGGTVNRLSVQGSVDSPHSPRNFEQSDKGQQQNTGISDSGDAYTMPAGTWPFGLNRVFGHTSNH